MDVYNNMIVNNVSTHEGGGVGINDTPNVRFFNNTVMKNVTTATARHQRTGCRHPPACRRSKNSDAAAGDAARRLAAVQRSAVVQQHLLGQPRRHQGTDVGHRDRLPGDADQRLGPRCRRRQRSAVADELGDPVRRRRHAYTTSPTQQQSPIRMWCRRTTPWCRSTAGGPTRPSSGRSSSASTCRRTCSATTTSQRRRRRRPVRPRSRSALTQAGGTLNAPTFDIDDQSRPSPGGFDAGADEFPGGVVAPPPRRRTRSTSRRAATPTRPGVHRHRRRRRHLLLGRQRLHAGRPTSRRSPTRCRRAPTSTASYRVDADFYLSPTSSFGDRSAPITHGHLVAAGVRPSLVTPRSASATVLRVNIGTRRTAARAADPTRANDAPPTGRSPRPTRPTLDPAGTAATVRVTLGAAATPPASPASACSTTSTGRTAPTSAPTGRARAPASAWTPARSRSRAAAGATEALHELVRSEPGGVLHLHRREHAGQRAGAGAEVRRHGDSMIRAYHRARPARSSSRRSSANVVTPDRVVPGHVRRTVTRSALASAAAR